MYSGVHKIKNKDKRNQQIEKKYLNAAGLEPTSFEC